MTTAPGTSLGTGQHSSAFLLLRAILFQHSPQDRHDEQGQAQALTCSEKMPSRVFTSWAAVEDLGLWSPYPCRDNKKQ